jgi:hypothetical protein
MATATLEDVAGASHDPGTLFFQLYVLRDREFTQEIVQVRTRSVAQHLLFDICPHLGDLCCHNCPLCIDTSISVACAESRESRVCSAGGHCRCPQVWLAQLYSFTPSDLKQAARHVHVYFASNFNSHNPVAG